MKNRQSTKGKVGALRFIFHLYSQKLAYSSQLIDFPASCVSGEDSKSVSTACLITAYMGPPEMLLADSYHYYQEWSPASCEIAIYQLAPPMAMLCH